VAKHHPPCIHAGALFFYLFQPIMVSNCLLWLEPKCASHVSESNSHFLQLPVTHNKQSTTAFLQPQLRSCRHLSTEWPTGQTQLLGAFVHGCIPSDTRLFVVSTFLYVSVEESNGFQGFLKKILRIPSATDVQMRYDTLCSHAYDRWGIAMGVRCCEKLAVGRTW
jgi:hypothetical protein